MKIYIIKNSETGLYSLGGYHVKWSKVGKFWSSAKNLKSHLDMMCSGGTVIPKTWSIEEIDIDDIPTETFFPAREWFNK